MLVDSHCAEEPSTDRMVLAIVLSLVVLACLVYYQTRKTAGLPDGVRGWPLIGHIPARTRHLFHQVDDYRKQFGDVFSWRMGCRDFVFLCNFKDIKQAFNNPLISGRPDFHSFLAFSYGEPIGIANSSGESWQNLRRFTLKLLRDRGMGKSSFETQIEQEVAYIVDDFKLHTNETDELPWSLNIAVLNVTWRLLADTRYDVQDPIMQQFQKLMRELFEDFQGYVQLMDYFPWLINATPKFLVKWLGIQRYYDGSKAIQDFIESLIKEYEAQDDSHKNDNFIGCYLKEMKKTENGEKSDFTRTFNRKDLIVALSDMFSAASESTSSTIRWIMHYMAKFPEVQIKVQNEIDSVCPRDVIPRLDDRVNLPYTNAVTYEVMRHMTVTPFFLQHFATDDTTVGEHIIPKGTIVMGSAIHCHTDPSYWERPSEFYPEHFLDADGKFDGKKEAFVPFSLGRRICPGESIAKTIVFLTTSALLQSFTFSPPAGKTLSLDLNPAQSLLNLPVDGQLTYKLRT